MPTLNVTADALEASSSASRAEAQRPRLLVYTRVFPSCVQPIVGVFVKERMFRVGKLLPLVVVAPVPWFPFLGLIRLFKPSYRPAVPYFERIDGIDVYHPRFLSIPAYFKFLDGFLQAICSLPTLARIRKNFDFDIIDSHFVYPDGVAAGLLARWLNRPFTITLRGQIEVISRTRLRRRLSLAAMRRAARVFSVAESLRQGAVRMGEAASHIRVVGNGVDAAKFTREDREQCRSRLGLPHDARVLVSVGGLTERKGFHRVIETLPDLRRQFPGLRLVIAGGASPEGDWSERLKRQVAELGLADAVHFLGPVAPAELKFVYSAADVFVLATRMEGWANVFLEAMACGLPVVTTLVGGNAEVVNSSELGILVPYGNREALHDALVSALKRRWDAERIMQYARASSWDTRIPILIEEFQRIQAQREILAQHEISN